jgi:enoyl-CoA hydratase/carnithine racemase
MKEVRMDSPYTQILFGVDQGVATLTLHRPERMNALGAALIGEVTHALHWIETEREVSVLVLTAAEARAFSSGADLKERAALDSSGRWVHNRALSDMVQQVARLPTPTIAAINGLALGGGCELALACDLRIAAEHAAFALPEVGLGIIPGAGGTQRLPRLIGPARAKELIFSARRISAELALEWGLINQICSADALLTTAHELARQIARQSPLAVAYAKHAIDSGLDGSLEQGLHVEAMALHAALHAEDYQLGLAAFAERKPASFPPRKTHRIV